MARFVEIVVFSWILCSLKVKIVAMDMNISKPFISTSLICYTYQKKNELIIKRLQDDCMLGNKCCYSVQFINRKLGDISEFGGCEDEYRSLVAMDPILRSMLPIMINYICEEGTCIEHSTDRDIARLCACTEHNCNMDGIDFTLRNYQERVKNGLVKKPPDFVNLLEQTMQILLDG